MRFRWTAPPASATCVLYFPDEVLIVDHYGGNATVFAYDFTVDGASTAGLPRTGSREPFKAATRIPAAGITSPANCRLGLQAVDYFKRGDLFEVVPGQTFYERPPRRPRRSPASCRRSTRALWLHVQSRRAEYLVGASPEMYVRVTGGRRVETCPISGTIRRGKNAIEDEAQIRTLLNSKKDEAELTMCSDVDRNDKSRICDPASVRVIGRRQIEMYSRLIPRSTTSKAPARRDGRAGRVPVPAWPSR